jgi:hypothetical protein
MAMVLLVTYDLNIDDNYGDVIDAIERLGPAVQVQRSVWVVASKLSAEKAFEHVVVELEAEDRLYVAPLAPGSYWRGALCGSEALNRVLAAGRG